MTVTRRTPFLFNRGAETRFFVPPARTVAAIGRCPVADMSPAVASLRTETLAARAATQAVDCVHVFCSFLDGSG